MNLCYYFFMLDHPVVLNMADILAIHQYVAGCA